MASGDSDAATSPVMNGGVDGGSDAVTAEAAAAAAAAVASGALACDLTNPRYFQGVLNGLFKRAIFHEDGFSNDFLREQCFVESAMSAAGINDLLTELEAFIVSAARNNWSVSAVRAALDKTALPTTLRDVFESFWRTNALKAHEQLVNESCWTNTVKRVSWRVDVVTASKSSQNLSEPIAIMELRTGKRTDDAISDVVQFEMDRAQLATLAAEVAKIEAAISLHSGGLASPSGMARTTSL